MLNRFAAHVFVPVVMMSATSAVGQPLEGDRLDDILEFQQRVADALPTPRPPAADTGGPDAFVDFGRGPLPIHVPAAYDGSSPTPLVIALHGYMTSGPEIEAWFQFASLVDEYEFLYLYPTGETDFFGLEYWNATDACCDLFGGGADDSGYLRGIIDEMQRLYNVDPRRIHFVGHSNGGFMSYRMACDHADVVASIASLAGATFLDAADCTPANPVHVLQIHGTNDSVIDYDGGCIVFGGCYPGAVQTAETWAAYDGCATVGAPSPDMLDLDATIPGAESTVVEYLTDCAAGGSAALWTIPGGPHSPQLSADFSPLVIEYLLDHPKPALCPADLDGDDAVGSADLAALLSAWGPCAGCAADLDGDGAVGASDLAALLGAWGSCR